MSDLPEVGQPLWLRDATGAGYDTRVVSLDEATIVLERPEDFPAFIAPQELELLWPTEGGLFRLAIEIPVDGDVWRAQPVATAGPAQRRAYARVAAGTPMILVWGEVAVDGLLADISEKALRVKLPSGTGTGLEAGTLVHADIVLDDETFVLPGSVLRVIEDADGPEVVVMYDAAGEHLHRLRRGLFFEQLRLDAIS